MSEEGNPAGLSSCSGGLRPLVELLNICTLVCVMELPQVAQWSRIYPPMQAMRIQSLGQEDLLEEGTATHSGVLA